MFVVVKFDPLDINQMDWIEETGSCNTVWVAVQIRFSLLINSGTFALTLQTKFCAVM